MASEKGVTYVPAGPGAPWAQPDAKLFHRTSDSDAAFKFVLDSRASRREALKPAPQALARAALRRRLGWPRRLQAPRSYASARPERPGATGRLTPAPTRSPERLPA